MKTVPIPGGTAQIRERADLRQRDRRRLEVASMAAASALEKLPEGVDLAGVDFAELLPTLNLTAEQSERFLALQEATILALLAGWSLDRPLPESADDLLDLDVETYEALAEITKGDGAREAARILDFSVRPEPESPTEPSVASAGGLRDETGSQSTMRFSPSGASTGTGRSSAA